MKERSVWEPMNKEESPYVPRCSNCGGYKEGLWEHWFFTGVYCRNCVRYVLYGDYGNCERAFSVGAYE